MARHQPRKRFGQHFLHDAAVIARILDAVAPQTNQRLVEIGPGLGAITLPLLQRVGQLDAIEIDRDAVRHLTEIAAGRGELRIHNTDVLDFDFAGFRGTGPLLRAVGNLPYNISTPLLFHLIAQRQHFSDWHFMLQKEVVERMAAGPGSKTYGRLSVMLAPFVTVTALFDIGPAAFRPAPQVTSTFARIEPHAVAPFELRHPDLFARIVATAFAHRRKTLRNALRSVLTEEELNAAAVDPALRPERIAPAQFAMLADVLAERGEPSSLSRPL
jgi:16S rRNA (adenine1518-N6/adenine1519-N6)-dimethyltransferase